MKYLFSLLTCLLLSMAALAQQGTLSGKVKDQTTGEPVIGAVVYIAGSSKGSTTDLDGSYSISLEPGFYKITVSSLSYKPRNIENVKVEPNKTTVLNINIEENTREIAAVTIVGTRETNTDIAMITDMKKSEVVVSGISGEQMTKTMDRDAADVVKRIPGVTVMNDKYISIRGLGERYNTVMLNDALAPSMETDSRAFSFDVIPTSVVDRILIYKGGSPELPGEFGGGVIKLYTKNFADETKTSISLSTAYRSGTTFNQINSYNGGSTDFLGFDDGTRTLPARFPDNIREGYAPDQKAHFARQLPNNWRITENMAAPDLRLSLGHTHRLNIGNVQVSNISSISYSNTRQYFGNIERYRYDEFMPEKNASEIEYAYNDEQSNQNVRLGVLHNWAVRLNENHKLEFRNLFNQLGRSQVTMRRGSNNNGVDVQNGAMRYESRSIYSGQLQGTHDLNRNRTQLTWAGGYGYTNRNEPDYRRYRTQRNTGTNDPFTLYISRSPSPFDGRFYSELHESSFMASGEVEHKIAKDTAAENPAKIRAGFYTEYKARDFNARWFSYVPSVGFDNNLRELPVDQIYAPENIYPNGGFELDEGTNPEDAYKANNLLVAGYAGAYLPLFDGKVSAAGGIRAENNLRKLEAAQYGGAEINKEYPELHILPSLNLTYNFSLRSMLRMGYSMSVNRPEFREQAPFTYYDFNYNVEIKGDTLLKTARIQNFDLRYELYPNPTELISVGVFYKKFTDPIESVQANTSGTPRFTFQNALGAYSTGAEVEIRKSLLDLSENKFVQNLTLVLNAAVIKSQVELENNEDNAGVEKKRALMGQSPYIINTGVYYQNDDNGLQVSLLYNIIGKRIFMVGNYLNPTIYEMPRHAIDLSITKRLSNQFELKAGIQDLLNQKNRLMQDSDRDGKITGTDEPIEIYRRGTYTSIGITYKF